MAEIARRQWGRVGVLGMGDPLVYTQPLRAGGIATETIDGEPRKRLEGAILKLMEGRDDADSVRAAREAVGELRRRHHPRLHRNPAVARRDGERARSRQPSGIARGRSGEPLADMTAGE